MKWMTLAAGGLMTLAVFGCGGNSSSTTAAAPTTIPGPEGAKAEADKLFVDLQNDITAQNWYPADSALDRLEKLKPNLSPEYAAKVDALKKSLLAAKSAAAQKH